MGYCTIACDTIHLITLHIKFAYMHWLLDPFRLHYADFKGRATRKEYWMFQLGIFFFVCIFYILLGILLFSSEGVAEIPPLISAIDLMSPFLVIVWVLGATIPILALGVRRLHDIGLSGGFLMVGFIPIVGGIIFLVLTCLPSQAGSNKYGPNRYAPLDSPEVDEGV